MSKGFEFKTKKHILYGHKFSVRKYHTQTSKLHCNEMADIIGAWVSYTSGMHISRRVYYFFKTTLS